MLCQNCSNGKIYCGECDLNEFLQHENDVLQKEINRLKQIRYNATEAHMNIQSKLQEKLEKLQQEFDSYKETAEGIHQAFINAHNASWKLHDEVERLKLNNSLADIIIKRLKEENEYYRETLEYIIKRGYTGAMYVALEAIKRVDESRK